MNMAEVIAFPADRDVASVRRAALQLDRKHGPAADRWWRTECNCLAARLQLAGFGDAVIRDQVDRFANAVQNELRRHAVRQDRPEGGAA